VTVKRIMIFALLLALIVGLSGCSLMGDSAADIEARKICNFKKIYSDVNVGISSRDDIYVDITTGVLYFRTWNIDGFTPLYNADGTLKIWDGYKKGDSNVQQETKTQD